MTLPRTPAPSRRPRAALCAVFVLLLAALASPFAGRAAASTSRAAVTRGATTSNVSIISGGKRRGYLLVTPKGPTAGLPLIVELHGYQALPSVELARSGFLPLAQAGKVVLAFPMGYGGSWNTQDKCCGPAYAKRFDDVTFVHDVVDDVEATLHTKTTRTYLVGFSNGGKLMNTIACLAPQGFTAFAEYGANPDVCPTRIRAPFFLGAGALDPEEPIAGKPADKTGPHPPLASGLNAIRTRDGCHGSPSVTTVGQVKVTAYTHCAKGAVTYALWQHNDHRWPAVDRVGQSDSAATLMWSFLYAHQG